MSVLSKIPCKSGQNRETTKNRTDGIGPRRRPAKLGGQDEAGAVSGEDQDSKAFEFAGE